MLATISNSPRKLSIGELLFLIIYALIPILVIITFPKFISYYQENIETNETYKENPALIITLFYVLYLSILFIILSKLQKRARFKVKQIVKYEKENDKIIIPDNLRKYLPEQLLKVEE